AARAKTPAPTKGTAAPPLIGSTPVRYRHGNQATKPDGTMSSRLAVSRAPRPSSGNAFSSVTNRMALLLISSAATGAQKAIVPHSVENERTVAQDAARLATSRRSQAPVTWIGIPATAAAM